MAFVVVYDACVLYPQSLRDLLIRLAMTDLFQGRWSNEILDECFRSILEKRPDLSADRLARTRDLMNRAVRGCLVTGYETLIPSLQLPDLSDRHVLAAAIRCGAEVIVTTNIKDFPAESLVPFRVKAEHPDEFVLNLVDLDPATVLRVIDEQSRATRQPPLSIDEVLAALERVGLVQSVARLRELNASG